MNQAAFKAELKRDGGTRTFMESYGPEGAVVLLGRKH